MAKVKPKPKLPRVSVSLQLNFKDSPAGYRGFTQENWVFGRDEYSTPSALAYGVAKTILAFWLMCFQQDISAEIQTLASFIAGLKVGEE